MIRGETIVVVKRQEYGDFQITTQEALRAIQVKLQFKPVLYRMKQAEIGRAPYNHILDMGRQYMK
jgi:hypothetical protein